MKYKKLDYIWQKKYLKRFIAGMVGYGFMLPLTIFIGKKVVAGNFIMILIALLPVIPFLLAMSAYLANMKTMDEMWRKIQSDALIMTALITITFSFSLGMLQVMNILQNFSIFYVFPFMFVIWALCFAYLIARNKLV
ncbi:MAG TPA: hypothetical protein ENJ60_04305 [Aeromonadales bacterium]|nr:hypothetical protein [Aeromonadales bacterium]